MTSVVEQAQELVKFLKDVWWEIHPQKGRVTWPTLKSIKVSTIVVVASSVAMGIYISLCDWLLRAIFMHHH